MIKRLATPECIIALFDGVFAVALPILVLNLKAPHEAAFGVLPQLSLPVTLFILLHVMYTVFCAEDIDAHYLEEILPRKRRRRRIRSTVTVMVFAVEALLALVWPITGMALICLSVLFYLRPEIPGAEI